MDTAEVATNVLAVIGLLVVGAIFAVGIFVIVAEVSTYFSDKDSE